MLRIAVREQRGRQAAQGLGECGTQEDGGFSGPNGNPPSDAGTQESGLFGRNTRYLRLARGRGAAGRSSMKSWKDQLRDIKSALRGSGRGKERGYDPPKIDFEPPPSWRTDGQSPPKKPPTRNPVQKSATLVALAPSAEKPSARPSALPPPFKPRIDDGCTLNMPEWGDIGRSLQHP